VSGTSIYGKFYGKVRKTCEILIMISSVENGKLIIVVEAAL